MFIHGGKSDEDKILNDSFLLNLNTPMKWTKCNIKTNIESPYLAFHSCTLVVSSDVLYNPKFNIYKFPEQTTINQYHSSRVRVYLLR